MSNCKPNIGTWTHHHLVVYLLTYCIYTIFHASRKAYSNVKTSLSQEWTCLDCNSSWPCPVNNKTWDGTRLFENPDAAEIFLGLLDSLFLFAYAVGMYFTSAIADRVELRKALSIGMWISGILLFVFGVLTQWLHFYNKAFYAVFWVLQGVVQSVGWPVCIATIGNWFGKSGRGIIFGLWASCASVGNIIGNGVASALVFYGYEYVFLTIAAMMFGGGVIVFCGMVNSPEEIGLPKPVEIPENGYNTTGENQDPSLNTGAVNNHPSEGDNIITEISLPTSPSDENTKAISFLDALLLPGVILYSLSFACLKLVNYAFLFWLPFYLTSNFKWDEAKSSSISTWYDVGGIIGAIACGVVTDRLKNRSPVLFVMLLISPLTLWGYKSSPRDLVVNCVLMAIVGFFINGVSSILSSAIAVDIAKQDHVSKNGKALATVTGIIDGTGSLGAAIGQYLVAVIETRAGWGWVFNFFIIANSAAMVLLLPVFYNDLKQYSCCVTLLDKIYKRRNYIPIDDDNDGVGEDNVPVE